MSFFELKFGLSAAANQNQILDLVKSNGGSGIQTSSGLFLQIDKTEAQLKSILGSSGEGLQISEGVPSEQAPDVAAFINAQG